MKRIKGIEGIKVALTRMPLATVVVTAILVPTLFGVIRAGGATTAALALAWGISIFTCAMACGAIDPRPRFDPHPLLNRVLYATYISCAGAIVGLLISSVCMALHQRLGGVDSFLVGTCVALSATVTVLVGSVTALLGAYPDMDRDHVPFTKDVGARISTR